MGKVYLICSTYGSGGTGKGIKTMNYHLIFFWNKFPNSQTKHVK